MNTINIVGARTHNLKNINLIIPRGKFIVVSGLSGSGKSSLVFNTLYAEGQRRYVESLPTYARQFLPLMEKPDVDYIEGLSPAISIEQKLNTHNPRSTVGTVTEINDYLRLLFARIGEIRCPDHNLPLAGKTISQMVDDILIKMKNNRLILLSTIIKERKGEHSKTLENLVKHGYIRARINGKIYDLSSPPKLNVQNKYTIEVVIDRFKVRDNIRQRLAESFETALKLSGGTAIIVNMDNSKKEEFFLSTNFSCPVCGYCMNKLEPCLFSFNNPSGACLDCNGLGIQEYFDPKRVIQNPQLSLANGAILGWNRHNIHYFQMLKSLSKHYKFDFEAPWLNLSESVHKVLLYGSGKENIEFKYINERGESSVRFHTFEGILCNMERRYKETESLTVREELSKFISYHSCNTCSGSRLRREVRHVFIGNATIITVLDMSIAHAINFFKNLKLSEKCARIAQKILKEIINRLKFLINVGLNYISLSRSIETLSGGEVQRIRLANQIGARLVGVMYTLDEPSIGLHQRDNERLLITLRKLCDLGNTVIVVEHDEDAIRSADHIIDIGPGAGINGGKIVAEGSLKTIMNTSESLTGQYLSGKRQINIPSKRVPLNSNKLLKLIGAHGNNLKNVNLILPIGLFTCITGVSGSGKSTLINDTLFPIAQNQLNEEIIIEPSSYHSIEGIEHLNKVINIDQNPIGRTPRSNPATYIGLFMPIRKLFACVPEARLRGYTPGRFSFNIRGGRCESCKGDGMIKVTMHFLPDIYVICDQCRGKRYNRETLEIKYKDKNIHEVLEMTIKEAFEFFDAIPMLTRKLKTLIDIGLSYIQLGQSATTLSGGEAQRIKLAKELSKFVTGHTLYILDEPTTGLHFADIQQLLNVLHQLRDQGNTIVVIEHNLDIIKNADWIVDLGPEGGINGGEILTSGTPEEVSECKFSHTARFLKPLLKRSFLKKD